MLVVISPAKTLDFAPQKKTKSHTTPDFLKQSRQLVKRLRELSVDQLCELMNISEKLAAENHARFKQWRTPFTTENAKQAVLAFQGDVYVGLQADTFGTRDFTFAQKHLRILSGLYGILRPLDLMQAYRLEMGTRLQTPSGKDLYHFWGETIQCGIDEALTAQGDRILVNLASNEYFKAVRPKALNARVITPDFKEGKDGKYRMISFFAKKARGMMASHIIRQRVKKVDDIKSFAEEGYRYNEGLSVEDRLVFTRDQ